MKKPFSLIFLLAVSFFSIAHAASFRSGTQPLVDGAVDPAEVVITGRAPIFSWEYTSAITSFTVIVSSDSQTFETSDELWELVGATTPVNTSSLSQSIITRVAYDGTALSANTTYFWQVTIFDASLPASATGQFVTVAAAAALSAPKLDLLVDWNNPFNPVTGGYTVLRYTSADKDRTLRLRIYNVSGDLVMEWPEHSAMQGAVYSQSWDGRNSDGDIVARGIYFANIMDISDNTGLTRRVFVVK